MNNLQVDTVNVGIDGPETANWPRYLGAVGGFLKSRMFTHRPFFLAHAMTFGCNSRCKSCTYWKNTPRMKEDLKTEEVYDLLDEGYAAGLRGYYMFGGEPLVRRDIGSITDYARAKGYITAMNTNGSLLEKKAADLEGLDFAFVSIDYHNDYDDIIRGRAGHFKEAMKGIRALQEQTRAKICIVTTISTLNWDTIEPMAELAKDLGVGISYNSVEQSLDFGQTDSDSTPNFEIGLDRDRQQLFYGALKELADKSYPLMETEIVLRDYVGGKPWKCHFPKMFVYVTPDRKVYNCDYTYAVDLKQTRLSDYLKSKDFRDYSKKAESCNLCTRTCVRSYSYTYDMEISQFRDLIRERNLNNSAGFGNGTSHREPRGQSVRG